MKPSNVTAIIATGILLLVLLLGLFVTSANSHGTEDFYRGTYHGCVSYAVAKHQSEYKTPATIEHQLIYMQICLAAVNVSVETNAHAAQLPGWPGVGAFYQWPDDVFELVAEMGITECENYHFSAGQAAVC